MDVLTFCLFRKWGKERNQNCWEQEEGSSSVYLLTSSMYVLEIDKFCNIASTSSLLFLSFSRSFFVFVGFSPFFIIPNLFPFKTETGTSDQCPVQFTAQNFVCSTPFPYFLVLENSAFSASTHIKTLQLQCVGRACGHAFVMHVPSMLQSSCALTSMA